MFLFCIVAFLFFSRLLALCLCVPCVCVRQWTASPSSPLTHRSRSPALAPSLSWLPVRDRASPTIPITKKVVVSQVPKRPWCGLAPIHKSTSARNSEEGRPTRLLILQVWRRLAYNVDTHTHTHKTRNVEAFEKERLTILLSFFLFWLCFRQAYPHTSPLSHGRSSRCTPPLRK